ncbi:MAG TPA: M56 family metallopeptidase [Granulicella sp.]|nr:M56 family metallopeptidase [Granulicella sp.]
MMLLSGVGYVEHLARLCAAAAVAGLWQGVVLAAVGALALRLAPRTTAAVRFLVWTAVLLGAALLPFLRLQGHGLGGAAAAIPEGGAAHALLHLGRAWSVGIAGLWLAFSVVRLVQLAVQGVRLRALWRDARPVDVDGEDGEIAGLLARVRLRRPQLCVSSEVDRPSVIGFFAPRVLIPDWLFAQLTGPELFQIVLHEVEHLRRGDDWLNLLQKLSLAVFPLNPALVWIERRLCRERELACDDGVLRVTLAPRVYASCLATLAERRLERRAGLSLSLGLLGAWGRSLRSGSELSRRVYSILNRQPALSAARTRAVMAMLAVGLAGCAVELARSPQLVSFAGPAPVSTIAAASPEPMASGAEALGLSGYQRDGRPGAGYQNVLFRAPAPGAGQAGMSLLRASVPTASAALSALPKRSRTQPGRMMQAGARAEGMRGLGAANGYWAQATQAIAAEQPATAQPVRGWVVLTSWTVTETAELTQDATVPAAAPMVVTVNQLAGVPSVRQSEVRQDSGQDRVPAVRQGERPAVRQVFPQYAAVPTDLGWLIVQL